MRDVVLRQAVRADMPAIEALLAAEWLPPMQILEWLETFWVLEDGDGVAGCAGLEIYGNTGVIRSVVVAPRVRGKGLGDLLSRTAMGAAERRGVRRLYLFTGDKAPFWQRYGFQECALEDWEPDARASWQWQAISERAELRAMVTPMRLIPPGA